MVLGTHMEICMTMHNFIWKNPLPVKIVKMDFWTLLVLCGNRVEWKYLWPVNILRRRYMWKKTWFSSYGQKSSLPIRFKYSLIVNISLMDWCLIFLHVDRHEWTQQCLLIAFPKKVLLWGKHVILGLQMARSQNFGSGVRIVFEILPNERDQEIHENFFNGFSEKILIWGKWVILGPKMACPYNPGFTLRLFLKFCIMEGTKRWMKITLTVFPKKKIFWAKGSLWTWKWRDFIALAVLLEFFWFSAIKGAKRYMKLRLKVIPKNTWLG